MIKTYNLVTLYPTGNISNTLNHYISRGTATHIV